MTSVCESSSSLMTYMNDKRFSRAPIAKPKKVKNKTVKFASVESTDIAYQGPKPSSSSSAALGIGVASWFGCAPPNSFDPQNDGGNINYADGHKPAPDKGPQDPDGSIQPPKLDTGPKFDQKVEIINPDLFVPTQDQGVPPKGDQYVPPNDMGADQTVPVDQAVPKDTQVCGKVISETDKWKGTLSSLDQGTVGGALILFPGNTSGTYTVEWNTGSTKNNFGNGATIGLTANLPNSSAKIGIESCTNNTNGGPTCKTWKSVAEISGKKYIQSPSGQYLYLRFTFSGLSSGPKDTPYLYDYSVNYCSH